MDERQDSSEEDFQLNSFSLRLKEKLQPLPKSAEEMNLKKSLEIDLEKNKGDQVPKLILKKLKLGGNEEENESETTNTSKMKIDQTKRNVKRMIKTEDKEEKKGKRSKGLSSEDEEKEGENTAVKRKFDKSKPKIRSERSNCLSSSDEEEANQAVKTNRNICKPEDKNKTKVSQTESLGNEDDKHIKSKRKSDQTKDKTTSKGKNSKCLSSEDEEEEIESKNQKSKHSIIKKTEEDKLKGDGSKEDNKVINKKNKSRDIDVSEKKHKNDIKQDKERGDNSKEDNKSRDRDVSDKKQKSDIKRDKARGDNSKEDNKSRGRDVSEKKQKNDIKQDKERGDNSKENNESRDRDVSKKEQKKDIKQDKERGDNSKEDNKSKDRDVSEKKQKKDIKHDKESGDNSNEDNTSRDREVSEMKQKKYIKQDKERGDNSKEDNKSRDVSEKKQKKDIKQVEECGLEKDIKTGPQEEKTKSKSTRKSKAKEDSDDEECIKSKKIKKSKDNEISEDDEKEDSNNKNKHLKENEKRSVGLDSSDDEHIDSAVVVKDGEIDDNEKSIDDCQTKDKAKGKKENPKCVSSKKDKRDIKNVKSERSRDKTVQNQLKDGKSEEDSKLKNETNKPKVKDVSEKKAKKDQKQDEESSNEEDIKIETQDNKLKSKSLRKSDAKENNSEDEESTKSKIIRIEESKEINLNEKIRDDKKGDTNKKSKNQRDINSSVFLESSDDEQINTAVIENGEISDNHSSSGDCQEGSKSNDTEIMKEVANGSNYEEDCNNFKLELQASSTENTEDIEMVFEKECNNKPKENLQDEAKENVSTKVPKKEKTKFIGLGSSSDEETEPKKKNTPKKRPVRNQKKPRNVLVLSSDDEEEGELEKAVVIGSSDEEDTNNQKDEDFAMKVESSAESSDSDILPKNKRKKKGSSDSDDSVVENNKNKNKKRRRVKVADSSDESGGSGEENLDVSLKDGESPAKGGRKNIKKIKKKGDLEQTTIEAAEEEKERRRRIEERQKLFNQVFEIKESAKLEKLVLDFDPDTKKELISVNKELVAKMKPHQAKGVKFMWDSCFESVKQIKKTKGSGCILAHCMGLGKTFQVISLIHTLITHEELTKVRTIMVVCPLSTVLNWVNEFGKWLEDVDDNDEIEVFHLTRYNKNPDRARELRRWQHNGGVLVMGYEMFRNLTNETTKKFKGKLKKDFLETLIDPGADLIVCDEGHMLKNEATALSKAMTRVRTLRRIVLTGTPMQNNLKEYHCMVQFVKPNLLGTSKEFLNRFVNPINNGQFVDSTDHDVKLMKRRAHVLHKMLEGLVQRFDYNVLTPFLPPKQEYVISVCLSELQEKLYSHYLENESQKAEGMKGGTRLFMDWQTLGRVWTHPRVLKLSTDKANWLREKKAMEESDTEGSLVDFIDDDSEKSTTTGDSSDDDSSSDGSKKKKKKNVHKSRSTRSTRQRGSVALLESSDEEKGKNGDEEGAEEAPNKGEWWCEFVEPKHFEDMRQSGKLLLLFAILKECELIEDKVLVFSQSLFSLDLIEYFLDKIDEATQEGRMDENLDNHQGTWSKGLDYFRLDGSTSSENRNIWCKAFNREDNPRARLFLISTRAGGLGINLTAANRVIIFDASWNPSHDIQSIFRIYRFGQRKPCYVYRFVAYGTMEEKVYERQVAKQSISNRVVDEQQVHRHFSMNDLTELYTFTPASKLEERPTPALPRDPLMAEILSQMKAWIEKYHEHDSLLENVVEEELNEEERKAAWEDFENDKKRGFMPPTGPQGPAMNPNAAWNQQIEIMRQQLKLRYANKSDEEINSILVYQVSILLRQQQQQQQQQMQMAAQMQAAGNMGYRPQMYGNNMMGGQMFNQRPQMQTTAYLRNIAPKPSSQQQNYSADQVYRMQQQANLARLQMQQMAQQQKTQQQKTQQQKSGQSLRSLLGSHLTGQTSTGQTSTNYPTGNIGAAVNARATAELQRMKQNYQSSREQKPGLTITEITDEPSGSSES